VIKNSSSAKLPSESRGGWNRGGG